MVIIFKHMAVYIDYKKNSMLKRYKNPSIFVVVVVVPIFKNFTYNFVKKKCENSFYFCEKYIYFCEKVFFFCEKM